MERELTEVFFGVWMSLCRESVAHIKSFHQTCQTSKSDHRRPRYTLKMPKNAKIGSDDLTLRGCSSVVNVGVFWLKVVLESYGPKDSSDTSCPQILTYMGEKMSKNWKLGKMAKIGPNFGPILAKTHATRSLIKSANMVRFSNGQCPRVRLVQGYLKKFWPTKSSNIRLRKCAKTVKKCQKTRKSRLTAKLWRAPRTLFAPAFFCSKLILNR